VEWRLMVCENGAMTRDRTPEASCSLGSPGAAEVQQNVALHRQLSVAIHRSFRRTCMESNVGDSF